MRAESVNQSVFWQASYLQTEDNLGALNFFRTDTSRKSIYLRYMYKTFKNQPVLTIVTQRKSQKTVQSGKNGGRSLAGVERLRAIRSATSCSGKRALEWLATGL